MDMNEKLDALNAEKRELTQTIVSLEAQIAYSSNVTSKYRALSKLELCYYRSYNIDAEYRAIIDEARPKSFWKRLFRK